MANVKVKAADLAGAALDYAVAVAQGLPVKRDPMGFNSGSAAGFWVWDDNAVPLMDARMMLIGKKYSPSTHWHQGGPILEKGLTNLTPDPMHKWIARSYMDSTQFYGDTPLIAAMRCYVADQLGEDVLVPWSLL